MFKTEVKYLWFDAGAYRVKQTLYNIQVVAEWSTPLYVNDGRWFEGLPRWHREFIWVFSENATALIHCTKKGRAEAWILEVLGAKEEEAFRRLKAAMTIAPIP